MPPTVAFLGVFLFLRTLATARGSTDGPDVSALNVMFSSLNSPSSLTGWTSSGGDPCGRHWRGIKCSGSSVTEIKLSGLGLTGTMGYQLSSLTSVKYLDMSQNNLQGDIPYQLPPNAVHINLARNSFTGSVPYSISQMADLKYLNLANNRLSGQLTDMFGKLPSLSVLDLSDNQMTGNLPQTFGSLSSLKTLNLKNNQFTGSIDVLAALPLEDLDVENNHFSGWVPEELQDINNLQTEGNSWSSGPAPPGRHSSRSGKKTHGGSGTGSGVSGGAIAGIVISVFIVGLIVLVLVKRRSSSHYIDEENLGQVRPFTYLDANNEFSDVTYGKPNSSVHMKNLSTSSSSGLKPPPSDRGRSFNNDEFASKLLPKRNADTIDVSAFSFMDLQMATASFSASRIIGEGSSGRVYKAKYADGKVRLMVYLLREKNLYRILNFWASRFLAIHGVVPFFSFLQVLAVKRIDSSHLQVGNSEDFKNLVAGICRLRHLNIAELLGYCSESGHHLLVYDFQKNGSLHEFLHLSDEYSKPLTWDTRVRIALGTARAIEYLHETCCPPVIHKNVKSANVLLCAELNPHLSDCGLGVLYPDTKRNLGPGYNAPECTSPSAYTLKSDVYSFGVVMLELLTGRKPFDSSKSTSEQSLASWATPQLHDIDSLAKMVDPALRGLYPPKSLSRFADVIALCVQSEPEFRPAMSEVVQALHRCVQRTSMNKRHGDDRSASRRSDDSDY
ncbi:protein STRUBBELIG-RECEPTOR FAMILY 5-like [Wolffia australiana]